MYNLFSPTPLRVCWNTANAHAEYIWAYCTCHHSLLTPAHLSGYSRQYYYNLQAQGCNLPLCSACNTTGSHRPVTCAAYAAFSSFRVTVVNMCGLYSNVIVAQIRCICADLWWYRNLDGWRTATALGVEVISWSAGTSRTTPAADGSSQR